MLPCIYLRTHVPPENLWYRPHSENEVSLTYGLSICCTWKYAEYTPYVYHWQTRSGHGMGYMETPLTLVLALIYK